MALQLCEPKLDLISTAVIFVFDKYIIGFPGGSVVKNLSMKDTQVQCLSWEDPLENEMATHSSILVWEIPWTEETGEL